ncbi:hypothetical protein FHU36_003145 [Nonomuraea muscovyensis]|uniref:DUF5667 domain-containing protein n=1 Tax=Nonomuraea muscovyensis TaxID=1124761 RepID=A0A7X0C2T2_9ACTN|nr:DUF5667 domain-containing protein [Nonomuraea muscovyensis]MBB6346636.1 hypothetical protein [Nonomuraea muscovyensis]
MGRSRRSREHVLDHLAQLRRLPLGGGPSDSFRERLRADLVSHHHDAGPAPSARPRASRPRRGLPWPSALATFGLAGVMMVSAFTTYRAVPGDTLYPLKRAAESTLVRLSADDVERGERELVSAKTRAAEVAELLGSSEAGSLVSETLREMERSTRSGIGRLERVSPRSPKISRFAQDQRDVVEPMLDQLDEAHQDQASGYLDYIEGLAAPPG